MMTERIQKTEEQWRQELTADQYEVLRNKGTERAFTGQYDGFKGKGNFVCAGCGAELFSSEQKYDSGSGWPSFWQPIAPEQVTQESDTNHGMVRTEALCSCCGGHLGHVFPDGPEPTGLRYCINSLSLDFADGNEGE